MEGGGGGCAAPWWTGELLAIGAIPLSAALMARGVAYSDGFPWQAGAGVVAVGATG